MADDNAREREKAQLLRRRLDNLVESILLEMNDARKFGQKEMTYSLKAGDLDLADTLLKHFIDRGWPIALRNGAFHVPVPPLDATRE